MSSIPGDVAANTGGHAIAERIPMTTTLEPSTCASRVTRSHSSESSNGRSRSSETDARDSQQSDIPLGRFGTPSTIAGNGTTSDCKTSLCDFPGGSHYGLWIAASFLGEVGAGHVIGCDDADREDRPIAGARNEMRFRAARLIWMVPGSTAHIACNFRRVVTYDSCVPAHLLTPWGGACLKRDCLHRGSGSC